MEINMPSKDDRTKAIQSNPCGICRANGSPVCKGHGGSCSSGSDDSSDRLEDASTKTTATGISAYRPISLETLLIQSAVWKHTDELTFKFESPNALFTMEIDMENNRIVFLGDKNLLREQQKELNLFLNTILDELKQFKAELTAQGVSANNIKVTRGENTLILSFGSAKQYDSFVQRLIDKNLIPMHPRPVLQEKHENHLVEEHGRRYNTPTPFNMDGLKR